MSILFINGSPNKNGNTAGLAEKLMNGRTYQTLVFLFQGGAPESWMMEKAEYTMAVLHGCTAWSM